jgi:flagellar biosynthesis/type III secretory pathway protein FliH
LEPETQEVSQTTQEDLEKADHDSAFDLGWEAGQNAIREHLAAETTESRLEGFKEGFAAGFKEGRIVGRNESLFPQKH